MVTPADLKQYRDNHSMTQQRLAELMGITRELLGKMETGKLPISRASAFAFKALLESEKESHVKSEINHSPAGKLPKRVKEGQLVPFYNIDFAAGDIEFYEDQAGVHPAYMMDIPEFSGCTAFRTYNNSMEKLIKSGDILFGTKVDDWASHLEYGQIYGIICMDGRKYLKYIRKANGKEDTHFLLKSENHEAYDDFLIQKNKIKAIWLIHGWINKRT